MNKLKLESVMRLHGDTGTSLAKFLKMSRTTFSAKINETKGAEFTQGEIAKIRSKYNLSPSDVILKRHNAKKIRTLYELQLLWTLMQILCLWQTRSQQ